MARGPYIVLSTSAPSAIPPNLQCISPGERVLTCVVAIALCDAVEGEGEVSRRAGRGQWTGDTRHRAVTHTRFSFRAGARDGSARSHRRHHHGARSRSQEPQLGGAPRARSAPRNTTLYARGGRGAWIRRAMK